MERLITKENLPRMFTHGTSFQKYNITVMAIERERERERDWRIIFPDLQIFAGKIISVPT